MDYWLETIEASFDEHGVKATKKQMEAVAGDVEVSHQCYGLAHYVPSGPSQIERERDKLKAALKDEQRKIICEECKGSGWITTRGPIHSGTSQCWKCRGDGRHLP